MTTQVAPDNMTDAETAFARRLREYGEERIAAENADNALARGRHWDRSEEILRELLTLAPGLHQQAAVAASAVEVASVPDGQLPTDDAGLYTLLDTTTEDWGDLEHRLAEQLGDEAAARRLLDRVAPLVENGREIERLRGELRTGLDDTIKSLADVERMLAELQSKRVFDVEYAEGGARVRDLEHFLEEAGRSLRLAKLVNDTIVA